MSTTNVFSSTTAQRQIEERLDTIDRALLGLLPRGERLAMVAQVETRIAELAANVACEPDRATPTEEVIFEAPRSGLPLAGRGNRSGSRRLSRLALTAGVMGMLALALLLLTPVTYFLVVFVAEAVGEVVAVVLLGGHTLAVAVGGLAAVALGIVALVKLSRRSRNLWGHGWAITGLCTGPLPMFAGGVIVLITGLQLLTASFVRVEMTTSNPPPPMNSVAPLTDTAPASELSSVNRDAALANGQAEPAKFVPSADEESRDPPAYYPDADGPPPTPGAPPASNSTPQKVPAATSAESTNDSGSQEAPATLPVPVPR